MLRLFEKESRISSGGLYPAGFRYLKDGIRRELDKIVTYYRNNVTNVGGGHLIARLIMSMPLQVYQNYEEYVDLARDASRGVAKSIGFTTPLSPGKYTKGSTFYNDSVDEIIITDNSEFDLVNAIADWRSLQPIKVLAHPYDDLSYGLCDGNYPVKKPGLAIITINIPMLMLQYRRWCEVEKGLGQGSERTLWQFVKMYPITNMVYSHTDICVLNRLSNNLMGLDPTPTRKHYPFPVLDYSQRLDAVLDQLKVVLNNRPYDFEGIVNTIPLINAENIRQATLLPDDVINHQNSWALYLARLPLIKFLLSVNESSGSFKNQFYMNEIKLALLNIRYNAVFNNRLPEVVKDEVERDIEKSVLALL